MNIGGNIGKRREDQERYIYIGKPIEKNSRSNLSSSLWPFSIAGHLHDDLQPNVIKWILTIFCMEKKSKKETKPKEMEGVLGIKNGWLILYYLISEQNFYFKKWKKNPREDECCLKSLLYIFHGGLGVAAYRKSKYHKLAFCDEAYRLHWDGFFSLTLYHSFLLFVYAHIYTYIRHAHTR